MSQALSQTLHYVIGPAVRRARSARIQPHFKDRNAELREVRYVLKVAERRQPSQRSNRDHPDSKALNRHQVFLKPSEASPTPA